MAVPSRPGRSRGRAARPSSADRLRDLSARAVPVVPRSGVPGPGVTGPGDDLFADGPAFGPTPWQPVGSAGGWIPDLSTVPDDHPRPTRRRRGRSGPERRGRWGADPAGQDPRPDGLADLDPDGLADLDLDDLDVADLDPDGLDPDGFDRRAASWDDPADVEPSRAPRFRAVRHRTDRWTERWVPQPLRQSRTRLSRRAAVLLTVTGVVAVLVAGWSWWSGRPEGQQVGAAPAVLQIDPTDAPSSADVPTAGAAPTVPSTGAATPPAVGSIWVSVTGRVASPGLYTLPSGSRVADALTAAGGLLDQNDLTGINLAQPLTDGQSVVVAEAGTVVDPAAPTPVVAGGTSPAGTGSLIDLNNADQVTLETLPGVGPVMAQAIVSWRTDNGPFTSVDQLQEVSGIGPARFAQLAPLVSV